MDVVKLLLAHGADVNTKDNTGQTPLFDAAVRNSTDVAELLLANRADVNATDKDGQTPLHEAVAHSSSMVDFLRQHGGHE